MTSDNDDDRSSSVETTPTMAMLNKSEIDQQVATAHAFPRSMKAFMAEATALVTMTEEVADACGYALPRRQYNKETRSYVTKTVEGPSARFAEIIFSCWGNARAGTRIVDEGPEFVTAQGFMFDLQKNVAIQVDVPRRIVDSSGNRYKTDMIGVTANAAASIALRNAILKVIPKALWEPIYQTAKATAIGNEATLSNKRAAALVAFQKRGASSETLFEHFGVAGIEDITLDHLATMKGYLVALKEGDTTVELLFGKDDPAAASRGAEKRTLADLEKKVVPPAAAAAPIGDGADARAPEAPAADDLIAKMKAKRTADALGVLVEWNTPANYPDEAVRVRIQETYEACMAKVA